jgi:hypothetical protein
MDFTIIARPRRDAAEGQHGLASAQARHLCDRLYEALHRSIASLRREHTKQWCVLSVPGRTKMAYVSHRSRTGSLEIWCRGEASELRKVPGVRFRERSKIEKGWEASFQGRFEVTGEEDLPAAVRCLAEVSQRACSIK